MFVKLEVTEDGSLRRKLVESELFHLTARVTYCKQNKLVNSSDVQTSLLVVHHAALIGYCFLILTIFLTLLMLFKHDTL